MNESDKIKPDVKWMENKYHQFNFSLFNGELGYCSFDVKPLGAHTIGQFTMKRDDLYVDRRTRRIYLKNRYTGEKDYVYTEDFPKICNPTITLNSNFTASEESWCNTMVHEMCHYYTYMNGIAPRQSHGTEFRLIASLVLTNSKGRFTIQRLATAEEMEQLELDSKVKNALEKRITNKLNGVTVVLVYRENGNVEMTITKSNDVINIILKCVKENRSLRGKAVRCVICSSDELPAILQKYKYTKLQRTYRFYTITGQPILNDLEQLDFKMDFVPENMQSKSLAESVDSDDYDAMIQPDLNLGVNSIN